MRPFLAALCFAPRLARFLPVLPPVFAHPAVLGGFSLRVSGFHPPKMIPKGNFGGSRPEAAILSRSCSIPGSLCGCPGAAPNSQIPNPIGVPGLGGSDSRVQIPPIRTGLGLGSELGQAVASSTLPVFIPRFFSWMELGFPDQLRARVAHAERVTRMTPAQPPWPSSDQPHAT